MSSWELTLRGYLTNEATVGEQGLVNIRVRRVRRSHFRDLGVRDSPSSPELKRRLTLPLSGLDSTCSHDAIEGALDFMSVSTDFQTPITERILSFASDLAATGSNRTEFYVNASLKIITSDELALITDESPPPPRDRSVMKLKKRRRLNDGVDDRDDPESCSICLDDLCGDDDSKLTELPCNHVFHDRCITRWLLTKNSCPLCRYKFDDHYQSYD